tara:strand:+ start:413 stop:592 length:180 start_codon:yes stop_codon:yes gene_type:complete
MITTQKNINFPEWFQVFSFGKFVDEVRGRANALELARQIAKNSKTNVINHLGRIIKVGE